MPPAVNNNANNAAIQAAAKAEREEKLRGALKQFIINERRKQKEEFEAKVEEERLRKEREARERQNDLTLEETRSHITKLDQKLTDLRNEKQQLFLQLKKVLNDDENRKKQQKDNEMFAAKQTNAAPPPQVFLPPVHLQHQMPVLPKPIANQPVKRGRTPSPPAHQTYYKSQAYAPPKHDDRRGAEYARVLWNKPPSQYPNPTLFYQTAPNGPPPQAPDGRGPSIIYPSYNMPLRPAYHMELQPAPTVAVSKAGDNSAPKFTQVFHINLDQPPISQAGAVSNAGQPQKPQVTMEKISDRYHHPVEVKHEGPPGHGPPPPHGLPEGVVYSPLMTGMPLHANVMQIAGNPGQNPKGGASITQGYAPRGGVTAHEQQLARQQQLTVIPGQPGQQPQQPQYSYARHIY